MGVANLEGFTTHSHIACVILYLSIEEATACLQLLGIPFKISLS